MMNFSKRMDLSNNPLFLICGSEKSGKNTFMLKSGLAYDVYPNADSISQRETPSWFFAENAVYVSDVCGYGSLASENKRKNDAGNKKRQKKKTSEKKQTGSLSRPEAFYADLKRSRLWRHKQIDGILLIADVCEIIKSDAVQIDKLASQLRDQADAFVSMTGYRIPVYFILNKSDKIDGFRELFSDETIAKKIPYAGSLVYGDKPLKVSPKELFLSHYKKVYDALSDLCVLGAVNANRRESLEKRTGIPGINMGAVSINGSDPLKTGINAGRAAICRLEQELLLAESKLAAFIEAFFGNHRERCRPLFGGFFFTSSKIEPAAEGETEKQPAFSNHVLLGDVIPSAKHSVREAKEGTLFHGVKKCCSLLFTFLIFAIISMLIPLSGFRDARHLRELETELTALFETESTPENQYAALSALLRSYEFLKKQYMPPGRFIFGTEKASAAVMDVYFSASRELLIKPTVERLEASILQRTQRRGEPTADELQRLYRSLETYILLTGGYPPDDAPAFDAAGVTEVIERTLKISLGKQYNSLDSKLLRDNIGAVIEFAAKGKVNMPSDQNIIKAAQEKLTHTPRAETIYAATMESLRSPSRPVPIGRIAGRRDIVQHGREVSYLYTREGWEQAVYAALIEASKNPFKNNWVTGPAVRAPVDNEKLLSELAALYAIDLRNRWLDFIRSASVNLTSDLSSLAADIGKLASQKSETGVTLAIACSLALQPPAAAEMPDMPTKKTSLADIKGQVSGLANKARGSLMNLTRDIPDPFAEAKKTFGPLEEFLTGEGFLNYRNDLSELAKTMEQCIERGGFGAAFAQRGENPISQSRKNLARAYVDMPDEVVYIVRRLLETPLDHSATVLARAVSSELEEAWSDEVVRYFNEKLAGRYPFDKNAPDAPYADFEEFFKPQSGVIWKHIDKNLTGLIERTPRGWVMIPAPPIAVFVGEQTLQCINRAEKISEAFFRKDGASQQDISFSPFRSSFGSAHFSIGDKPFDFSGGLPVTVSRSSGAAETVILRVAQAGRDAGELRFAGEWSLARLFDAARIEPLARGRYNTRWSVNVQNIYTAHVTSVVQSNASALFEPSIVRGFDVPAKALSGRK